MFSQSRLTYIVLGVNSLLAIAIVFYFISKTNDAIVVTSQESEWRIEENTATQATSSEMVTDSNNMLIENETITESLEAQISTTSIKIDIAQNTLPSVVESKKHEESAERTNPQATNYNTEEVLTAHNAVRAKVSLPKLTWSPSLADNAQKWSNQLQSENCVMRHDPNTSYGENIFWSQSTETSKSNLVSTGGDAVSWWANEVNFYDYNTNTCKSGTQCGHYTQIVWRSTSEVGCGVSSCFDNNRQTDVWVCRYNPAGNDGTRPY